MSRKNAVIEAARILKENKCYILSDASGVLLFDPDLFEEIAKGETVKLVEAYGADKFSHRLEVNAGGVLFIHYTSAKGANKYESGQRIPKC